MIKQIEIPVCLNLALCYLKTDQPHYGIKYCSQVLEKPLDEEQNIATLEKAYYRRGYCFLKIGQLENAKKDLNKCTELSPSNKLALQALQEIK